MARGGLEPPTPRFSDVLCSPSSSRDLQAIATDLAIPRSVRAFPDFASIFRALRPTAGLIGLFVAAVSTRGYQPRGASQVPQSRGAERAARRDRLCPSRAGRRTLARHAVAAAIGHVECHLVFSIGPSHAQRRGDAAAQSDRAEIRRFRFRSGGVARSRRDVPPRAFGRRRCGARRSRAPPLRLEVHVVARRLVELLDGEVVDPDDGRIWIVGRALSTCRWRSLTVMGVARQAAAALATWHASCRRLEVELASLLD